MNAPQSSTVNGERFEKPCGPSGGGIGQFCTHEHSWFECREDVHVVHCFLCGPVALKPCDMSAVILKRA